MRGQASLTTPAPIFCFQGSPCFQVCWTDPVSGSCPQALVGGADPLSVALGPGSILLTSEGHSVRSCILNLSSLGDSYQPENTFFCVSCPKQKESPSVDPHAPLKLQLTVSFLLYSQTSQEY